MLAALLALAYLPLTPNGGVPSAAFVRDAEIKHGRVALLALPALAAVAATGADPVRYLSMQPVPAQLAFFAAAGTLEGVTFARLGPAFSLREDVVPGQLWDVPHPPALAHAEDVAGRAAMLAAAAVLALDVF